MKAKFSNFLFRGKSESSQVGPPSPYHYNGSFEDATIALERFMEHVSASDCPAMGRTFSRGQSDMTSRTCNEDEVEQDSDLNEPVDDSRLVSGRIKQ